MGQPIVRSSVSACQPATEQRWRRLSSAAPRHWAGMSTPVRAAPPPATTITRVAIATVRPASRVRRRRWLAKQHELLLPVPYFLVTFTLPAQLRSPRSPEPAPTLLAALPEFGDGVAAVGRRSSLSRWADRDGGCAANLDARPALPSAHPLPGSRWCAGTQMEAGWLAAKGQFLVHAKPLAALFRGKSAGWAAAAETGEARLRVRHGASPGWWIVGRSGRGQAALKYLAPYVFRVALSNNRIVRVANDQVTFRYRDGETKKTKPARCRRRSSFGAFCSTCSPKAS